MSTNTLVMTRIRLIKSTPGAADRVRKQCERVLNDPDWRALVVSEAMKQGQTEADVLQQAVQIIAALN